MIERIEVLSQEELLLQTLTDLIQEAVATESNHYSISIAEVYAEFMRELLVDRAEGMMGLAYPDSLLSMATSAIELRVRDRLGGNQSYEPTGQAPTGISPQGRGNEPQEIQFSLLRYKETTWKALKVSAKELLLLQEELKQARQQNDIPMYNPIEEGEQGSFWISEVGLKRSEIQALVAQTNASRCYLDFSRIAEYCTVRGEWFPFELIVKDPSIGDLVFVVDQDGSIHIHTDNFPAEAFNRVRSTLRYIAGKVYVEAMGYDSEWANL